MTILLLTGIIFVMILLILHGRIYLNLLLLLLLANFGSESRLELMCNLELIFLIVNISSSLTHFHGFQLLVLLPQLIEINFFNSTNRIDLLNLKLSSGRIVLVAKWFLKLWNLHMLIIIYKKAIIRKLDSHDFCRIAFQIVERSHVCSLYLSHCSSFWGQQSLKNL